MERALTIGRLARKAGVKISTLRYYERLRLVAPRDRTAGNYRIYGPGAAHRVRFILKARSIGFSLEEVRVLLEHLDGRGTVGGVKELLERRLTDVRKRMQTLGGEEQTLTDLLNMARDPGSGGEQGVIHWLSRAAGEEGA